MGCGGSKIDLETWLINQPKDDGIIDGLVGHLAPVELKTGGGAMLAAYQLQPNKPLKLLQDGKLVATVEKKGTPWVLVVKDPAGAIVALLKNTGTARNAVNLVNFDSNTINEKHGANVTYAKFTTGSVFCSRPRREGQPTALTFEGVEMYAWADLHPTQAPPYATGAIVPNPLWHHLGCYNLAADGVSFESTPSFVLQRANVGVEFGAGKYNEWLATKEVVEKFSKPTEGVGIVPMSKDKLTVSAGVDPLLVALAAFESGAYDVEVTAGSGMPVAMGM